MKARNKIGMLVFLALALMAGCSPNVVYRDRVVTVNVPVPQPCAGERPYDPLVDAGKAGIILGTLHIARRGTGHRDQRSVIGGSA